jgi:hypothetical protein
MKSNIPKKQTPQESCGESLKYRKFVFGTRVNFQGSKNKDRKRLGHDAMPFQTRLTQTKPVLPLSNEHGSQVKDQGRRQCCHTKHRKFQYGVFPSRCVLY